MESEILILKKELEIEKRRVELLTQQNKRQQELIQSLNKRICKYESCHGMLLNKSD